MKDDALTQSGWNLVDIKTMKICKRKAEPLRNKADKCIFHKADLNAGNDLI